MDTVAVKVGSARIDENGKATGGKAGDQTGKEVSTQDWYLHSKGWVVLRAKNPEVAEKIARDMEYACNNSKIGYDQNQRDTLYNAAKPYGFDCSKVTTACECDCSSLVRVCVNYAGVKLGSIRTTNEATALVNTGEFTKLTDSKYTTKSDYLQRGDILVTKTQGHTVVVLSNGSKVVVAPVTFNNVYVTGGTVNVRTGPSTTYSIIGIAKKGDKIKYLGEKQSNWFCVNFKNKIGWISDKYSYLVQ